jgi:tetratricopeptide (TPR) repeat protein
MSQADTTPTPTAVSPAPARHSRRRIGIAILALTAAGAALWGYFRRQPEPPPTPPEVELSHVEPMVAAMIREARERLVAHPRNATAWGEFAMSLHGHGFHTQAKECYAQAERLDPANPVWPYLTADCDIHLNDKPTAIENFRRAASRPGSSPVAQLRLGEVLLDAGQLDAAEQSFKEVHRHDAGEPRAQLGLARIERGRGNLRGSLTHVHNCLARTGDMSQACEFLAELYHELGDNELAVDARKRATRRTSWIAWPDPYLEVLARWQTGITVIGRRATALSNSGRHAEAEAMLDGLVRREPNSAKAHSWYGRTLVLHGRIEEGERQIREALRLDPDYVEARFYLGAALAKQAKHAEAVVELRKVIAAQADHGDAHAKLGQCLYALGDKEGAANELAIAARYMPNDVTTQKNLAIMLYDLRKYPESVKHFEMAAALAPEDATIPILLKRSRVAAGQPPK